MRLDLDKDYTIIFEGRHWASQSWIPQMCVQARNDEWMNGGLPGGGEHPRHWLPPLRQGCPTRLHSRVVTVWPWLPAMWPGPCLDTPNEPGQLAARSWGLRFLSQRVGSASRQVKKLTWEHLLTEHYPGGKICQSTWKEKWSLCRERNRRSEPGENADFVGVCSAVPKAQLYFCCLVA